MFIPVAVVVAVVVAAVCSIVAIVVVVDIVLIALPKKLDPPPSFHTPNSSFSLVSSPPNRCHQLIVIYLKLQSTKVVKE